MTSCSDWNRAGWLGLVVFLAGCGDDAATQSPPPPEPACPLPTDNVHVLALEGAYGITVALMSDGSLYCWGEDSQGACAGKVGYGGSYWQPYRSRGVECLDRVYSTGGESIGATATGQALVWGVEADEFFEVNDRFVGVLPIEPSRIRSAWAGGRRIFLDTPEGLLWVGEMVLYPDEGSIRADELTLVPLPEPVKSIAGTAHACAVVESGELYCWGSGYHGILGLGVDVSATEPTLVPAPVPFVEVVAGFSSTCARTADGQLYCAGSNIQGILFGSSFPDYVGELTHVEGIPPLDRVWASEFRVCGTSGGELWCLGDPPAKLEGVSGVVDLTMAASYTCVLQADGAVLCQGESTYLGNCLEPTSGWHQVDFTLSTCPGFL